MKTRSLLTSLILTSCLICLATAQESKKSKATASPDEKAIRAAAADFVAAFNRGDAKGVADHWTENGVYTNEAGARFEGRKSIQSEYETLFKTAPKDMKLRVEVDSVRLINTVTAMEEGRAALAPQPPGAVRVMSRYTALHVKQDGKWLMTDVRDSRVDLPPDMGQLEDLKWLVGTWIATNKDTQVEVKCSWIENQKFVMRLHEVTKSGKVISAGRDIIGVDPSTGRITSWSFTADGGHAIGIWSPHDSGWVVESIGVLEDGTQTSSTNVLSQKDSDTLLWESDNRMVGSTLLPDTNQVTLKRK